VGKKAPLAHSFLLGFLLGSLVAGVVYYASYVPASNFIIFHFHLGLPLLAIIFLILVPVALATVRSKALRFGAGEFLAYVIVNYAIFDILNLFGVQP
jgi:hypothetical protein